MYLKSAKVYLKITYLRGLWSQSRKESDVFGWSRSRIPNNTGSRSRVFCPTPTLDVQLDHFSNHILKLRILVEMA